MVDAVGRVEGAFWDVYLTPPPRGAPLLGLPLRPPPIAGRQLYLPPNAPVAAVEVSTPETPAPDWLSAPLGRAASNDERPNCADLCLS